MRLPPFSILEPDSKKDALSMLDKYGKHVKIVAGGTELTVLLKLGLLAPAYVMSLRSIDVLTGIKSKKREVIIGSATTIREIAQSPLINDKLKGVAQAARLVAAPAIQNRATIGGNILQNTRCIYRNQSDLFRSGLEPCYKSGGNTCHVAKAGQRCFSIYQSDMAPPLISFNSKVKLERKDSHRIIPVADLFSGKGENPFLTKEDELLTEIIIPLPDEEYSSSYEKLRFRKGLGYPLASVAASVLRNKDKKTDDVCIVVGAAGSAPKIVSKQLAFVEKEDFPRDDSDNIGDIAASKTELVDNLSLPPTYRRKMVKVLTRRALQGVFQDMKEVSRI
jgi:4-hydroxybenzoyl-CoA reductase subunit beta